MDIASCSFSVQYSAANLSLRDLFCPSEVRLRPGYRRQRETNNYKESFL